MPKPLSPAAVKARLEHLAPGYAQALGELRDELLKEFHQTHEDENGEEKPSLAVKERVQIANAIQKQASDIFDRTGVPKLRQVQSEAVHRHTQLTDAQLLELVGRKLEALSPEDRLLLMELAPSATRLLDGD